MLKPFRAVVIAAFLTVATYAMAAEIRRDHPDTYVVKRGDTLWDIAGRFLERPWLWPEIWQANPQIANPHLIYPGDVISLAYLDRIAIEPGIRGEAPVSGIPLSQVEPFLKNLRVVDGFEHLPYVVGLEEDRLRSADGQVAYIKGLPGAQAGQRYAVVRPTVRFTRLDRTQCCDIMHADDLDFRGRRTVDFDNYWTNVVVPDKGHELLGFELMQQATGTISRGEVGGIAASTLVLDDSGREVRVGDRLIPVEAQPYDLQFFPHPPRQQFEYQRAQVIAVADLLSTGGPRDVVALSVGARDGIDNGTVFSTWRVGSDVADRVAVGKDRIEDTVGRDDRVRLP
ncbi:MAG TPA: LysM peptidoglycan-binding domain-containing protein, partial [Lysobacter sp.]|nr:LysM peptidoglycan-binding domain-containing protein [Lysobacter sp.]